MWTVTSFLDNLQYERNYSEETIKAYREDICQFENFVSEEFGSVELSSVTPDIVREWIMSLMDKGYTSTSINRKLSALRSLYKYLLRFNLVSVDPLRKVTGPKNKKKLPVFLKETDMNKLLDETAFEDGFKGSRDRLIIAVFYVTGIRLSELIGLDDRDIDLESALIKVLGKRRKQRLIPFDEELKMMIADYLDRKSVV